MSKTFYHYTTKENAENTTSEKLLKSGYSMIFACETPEDMKKFTYINHKIGRIDLENSVVIQFKCNAKSEVSYDHSSEFYANAEAIIFNAPRIRIKPIKVTPLKVFLKEELIREQIINFNKRTSDRPSILHRSV